MPRDRLSPPRHDDRPDDRTAAAHLRQRPGSLERSGQQRDVQDSDRERRHRYSRREPQRQPSDHPVLLRCGPAQQRGRPDCRRLVLRQRPGQRRAGFGPQHPDQRQSSPGAGPGGQTPQRRGHATSRAWARSTSTVWPVLRRRLTPTSSRSTARRPDLRPACSRATVAHSRPAVAVHGRCQLRRQPGQQQRHRHQLEHRPDLRHLEPGA